jgi:hypothetical protein
MSMETHVFFRGKLPGRAALARAMKELGFPFSITGATGSLERQSGFMPMKFRGEETGVELDVFGDHAAIEEFADVGVDRSFERRASFRWGGDFQEAVAGMCAAAALARLVDGVVFDEAENKLLSIDDAVALARRNLEVLAQPEAEKRPGTRPADIKRYLKPLLKERSDLALVGRHLIIRPVRHLLRGALLDRTSDKYEFRIWRYVTPLYDCPGIVGYGDTVHEVIWQVWQPYFLPLLLDALAEDIFPAVGTMTSLADFARSLEGNERFTEARCTALLLAGDREGAAALVAETEQTGTAGFWEDWARMQRERLEQDIGAVCAEFRSREAKTARALKLGDIWEPAPFPAEVSAADGTARCAEPRFVATPWIARPPGLLQEPPENPGEIRFAQERLWRNGRVIMLVALTREQAEERHRTRQHYALATRLPGGNLLVLIHHTGWSPHDPHQPKNPDYVPRRTFYLEVYGAMGRLRTQFDGDFDRPDVLRMWSVSLYDRITGNNVWLSYNDLREGEKTIYDHRINPRGYTKRPVADADLALCEFAEPRFGDFNDLWQRVVRYLHNEGFGRFE